MSFLWHSAKRLFPRRWRKAVRRAIRPPLYEGDYPTWADARRASQGYEDRQVLERVIAAARAVRDGQAAWERDSVLFPAPQANAPLLRALRAVAAAERGRLHLVDFGGALGSAWWQHRPWLEDIPDLRWSVVEQPALVEAGRREFTRGPLCFQGSLDECFVAGQPDTILLSSVLAYLESPHALLAEIRRRPFRHLVIDRTGFLPSGRRDRLTVQRVPPEIYPGSYPCWFFDREALLAPFRPEWRVVDEWATEDDVDIDAEHRGLFLERRTA